MALANVNGFIAFIQEEAEAMGPGKQVSGSWHVAFVLNVARGGNRNVDVWGATLVISAVCQFTSKGRVRYHLQALNSFQHVDM